MILLVQFRDTLYLSNIFDKLRAVILTIHPVTCVAMPS